MAIVWCQLEWVHLCIGALLFSASTPESRIPTPVNSALPLADVVLWLSFSRLASPFFSFFFLSCSFSSSYTISSFVVSWSLHPLVAADLVPSLLTCDIATSNIVKLYSCKDIRLFLPRLPSRSLFWNRRHLISPPQKLRVSVSFNPDLPPYIEESGSI